jgi:SAM-dependent methyltransferase
VVNVGAGTGSYEPVGRRVVAVEPSPVMAAQRSARAAPYVRGTAEALPFADEAFGAAMAILSLHHWTDKARGLAEMRRVARGPVVKLLLGKPEMNGAITVSVGTTNLATVSAPLIRANAEPVDQHEHGHDADPEQHAEAGQRGSGVDARHVPGGGVLKLRGGLARRVGRVHDPDASPRWWPSAARCYRTATGSARPISAGPRRGSP